MSQPTKQEKFTFQSFENFIKEINSKGLDMTKTSWKDIVRKTFLLDEEQEKSLTDVSKEVSDEVQEHFNALSKHLKAGGNVDGKIIENSNKTHTILLSLNQQQGSGSGTHSIIIACCDANCRNWRWGRHC